MPIQTRDLTSIKSKRSVRYKRDTEYRNRIKSQSRRTYRRKSNVEMGDCLYSLDFVTEFGKEQEVTLPTGEKKVIRVYSLVQASKLLQRRYQTVYRWIKQKMIPHPVLQIDKFVGLTNDNVRTYSEEEVRILIEEIGNHDKSFKYYRESHTDTRDRIERRFREYRLSARIIQE